MLIWDSNNWILTIQNFITNEWEGKDRTIDWSERRVGSNYYRISSLKPDSAIIIALNRLRVELAWEWARIWPSEIVR